MLFRQMQTRRSRFKTLAREFKMHFGQSCLLFAQFKTLKDYHLSERKLTVIASSSSTSVVKNSDDECTVSHDLLDAHLEQGPGGRETGAPAPVRERS